MRNWRGKTYRLWFRAVAIVVLLCFTVTTVAWADGQGGVIRSSFTRGQFQQTPISNTASDWVSDLIRIQFPSEIGEIKATFKGAQDRVVIYIKDAHVNEEAQRNIGRIIELLARESKVKLVGVEGASGDMDTALFAAFPDAH